MLRRPRAMPQPRSDAFDAAGYDDVVPIGYGGASTVYRARQIEFDRLVAVKVLTRADASVLRRFEREKRILGRLSGYPSIAQVFDAGVTASGAPFLVMQYHPGGSLADLVARTGRQSVDRVLQIGVRLAVTLDAAHTLGVLHRDIKPGNVMLDVMRDPVLADFGIAGLAAGGWQHTAAITYHFAAPEVVNDPTAASTASDQYSLALTLWALLVGSNPWQDLASRRLVPLPSDVPAAAAAVLERALSADPSDRHASCLEFAGALRTAETALGLPPTQVPGLDTAARHPMDESLSALGQHTADPDLPVFGGPTGAPVLHPSAGTPRRSRVLVSAAVLLVVAFTAGVATAILDRDTATAAAVPLVAPTSVAASIDGDAVTVTWDDTNGGRLPYFVYLSGSGDAAVVTEPGAQTVSLPLLPGGAGMCMRVGVLDTDRAATSDEVCV